MGLWGRSWPCDTSQRRVDSFSNFCWNSFTNISELWDLPCAMDRASPKQWWRVFLKLAWILFSVTLQQLHPSCKLTLSPHAWLCPLARTWGSTTSRTKALISSIFAWHMLDNRMTAFDPGSPSAKDAHWLKDEKKINSWENKHLTRVYVCISDHFCCL